jgi:RNA polymerase sigma-70 factor (ECF subfamily)
LRSGSSDESALIARARQGDLQAFDALVLRHQQQVFAVALRMLGDHHEAEDIAQDVFVQAFRRLDGFRQDAKLSTWLVSITINQCRNRRRWKMRRKRLIAGSLDAPVSGDVEGRAPIDAAADPAPSPAEAAQQRERERLLLGGLQLLDEPDRTVIILRDLEGYTYEEIARVLGWHLGTVKSRLNRARLRLRTTLEGTL